jgi:hypothetical protein
MYPGNGLIYWGRITHCNPSLDSDSNLIPNCLEATVEGSLTKFLQSYDFATRLLMDSEGNLIIESGEKTLEVV